MRSTEYKPCIYTAVAIAGVTFRNSLTNQWLLSNRVCRIVLFADKSTQVAPCIARMTGTRAGVMIIIFSYTHTKHPNLNSNSKKKPYTNPTLRIAKRWKETCDFQFISEFVLFTLFT